MEEINLDESIIRTGDDKQTAPASVGAGELVSLCAVNTQLYSRTFFPKTVRQEFAPFDKKVDAFIEGPGRFKMLQVFRGGAKTSKARIFISKRIAYGISRNILVLGKSEGHAKRSIKWVKNHVQYNKKWASTFGLHPGTPWTDTECEIIQFLPGMVEPIRIHLIGMGITGSVRGINTDDWRPDLIVLDDVLDEENSASDEQRQKNEALIYGAIMGSLAPESEEPNAMMLCLQTPLNKEDYSVKAENDPDWKFLRISILTDDEESAWPARWSTETVLRMKTGFIRRNKLSIWNREYECKLTSAEECDFRPEWLRSWSQLPPYLSHVLVIDPVPPPKEANKRKSADELKTDYEALGVVGIWQGQCYIREISVNRGHEPLWTISEFWRLAMKYKVQAVVVETVAYQSMLAYILRGAMKSRGLYYPIIEFESREKKTVRIVNYLSGPASLGAVFIPPSDSIEGIAHSEGMRQFVSQFGDHPNVRNDDALEVGAIGVAHCLNKLDYGNENAIDAEQALQIEEDARERRNKRFGRHEVRGELAP